MKSKAELTGLVSALLLHHRRNVLSLPTIKWLHKPAKSWSVEEPPFMKSFTMALIKVGFVVACLEIVYSLRCSAMFPVELEIYCKVSPSLCRIELV